MSILDSTPEKNTTSDAVKARLDDLSGLSRLAFEAEDQRSGFKGRVSFRDLMAFTFQPQNIVANPEVLFFKTDTYEHREKLKTIFPYVLKAVTAELLAAQHEADQINRTLARKVRELENVQAVSQRWSAELRAWVIQAREYGLIQTELPEDGERDQLLELLRAAVKQKAPSLPTMSGIQGAMDELVGLQQEESEVDGELRQLRRRFGEMAKLRDTSAALKGALVVQRDRLGIAKWLSSMEQQEVCPICASDLAANTSSSLQQLLDALSAIEADVKRVGTTPASFDREFLRVKQEIELGIEKLRGIAVRKREVEQRSSEARQANYRSSEMARFLGRLEQGLELHKELGSDSELAEEIEALRKRLRELNATISKGSIDARMKRALSRITNFAGRILPNLDAERPNDPIELSPTDLTIRVKGKTREDALWEIGSGANWLSYHVAVSLALQQLFLDDPPSPVPGFLVYDQPSQVYFPRKLGGVPGDEDPDLKDEDIEAVRKVFSTLAMVVEAAKGAFQVLVLDHAAADVWGNIPHVHLVEEWRGGDKLVPAAWIK